MLAGEAHGQTFRVVVVPGLQAHDLQPVAKRGAVGLLVAGAGPETSNRAAEAMLARGVVRNSLRDGLPDEPVRIRFTRARSIPAGSGFIVVGLPQGGSQPNNRRFAVAVVGGGYRGVLSSRSTRIPGIVSIADIADTALGADGALGWEGRRDALGELATLDRRIDDHNRWRSRTATWLELALAGLAAVSGTAAVLGAAAFLLANLALGAVDVAPGVAFALLFAAALAGLPLARTWPRRGVVAAALAAVLAAYLVSFELDQRWVALSPLGPTQNARFYGISNLLETFLLIPALAGAALLRRRPLWAAALAALSFLTIAGSRFGADGGGAIVLAVGFGVLAALLAGAGKRAVVLAAAGAVLAVLGLLALDAVLGVSSHVTRALEDGPAGLANDLSDRVTLSWRRATDNASTAVVTAVALAGLAALTIRALRLREPIQDRALPLAFAAAIAASMIVNDSPKDVALAGLAGYLAVESLALGPAGAAQAARSRLRRRPVGAAASHALADDAHGRGRGRGL
ncbi:MAG: hypothetical protein ACXWYS_06940 [Gaiellaceae bacterium]